MTYDECVAVAKAKGQLLWDDKIWTFTGQQHKRGGWYVENLHPRTKHPERFEFLIPEDFSSVDPVQSDPSPMSGLVADVEAFHQMIGAVPRPESPTVPDDARIKLHWAIIEEEYEETRSAMGINRFGDVTSKPYLEELADGLADLIYVCLGAAREFGIPMDRVWAEVQRSNMAKAGPDGKCTFRADGKLLKPEGWQPPDIKGALYDEKGFGSSGK